MLRHVSLTILLQAIGSVVPVARSATPRPPQGDRFEIRHVANGPGKWTSKVKIQTTTEETWL
jgi:hypothetical protein